MSKLIDADAVVAMLRQESVEWESAADAISNLDGRRVYRGIAKGYECAAQDVEKMANEQSCVDQVTNQKESSE